MPPSPLTDALRDHPLPRHDGETDKDGRGSVLVVAGSAPTPGAALLAAIASLRVGAGKLQIASAPEQRTALGIAVPEALTMDFDDDTTVARAVASTDAVVVGPGLLDDDVHLVHLVCATVIAERPDAVVVIDAGALGRLPDVLPRNTILMPNETEADELLGGGDAKTLARRYGAVVTVRGAATWTADPSGTVVCDEAGNPGMAASGSGDVLAGMVGGLAARGADPFTAVLWAVHLHGVAGDRLAERIAPIGFLARELLDVIPEVLNDLTS